MSLGLIAGSQLCGSDFLSQVGPTLWSSSDDRSIRVWQLKDTAARQYDNVVLNAHAASVVSMALSICGHVWSGGADGKLRVWLPTSQSAECIKTCAVDGGQVRSLVAVGAQIWCASHHSISIWDSAELTQLRRFTAHDGHIGWQCIGRQLETRCVWTGSMADKSVRMWESVQPALADVTSKVAERQVYAHQVEQLNVALRLAAMELEEALCRVAQLEPDLGITSNTDLEEALRVEKEAHGASRLRLENEVLALKDRIISVEEAHEAELEALQQARCDEARLAEAALSTAKKQHELTKSELNGLMAKNMSLAADVNRLEAELESYKENLSSEVQAHQQTTNELNMRKLELRQSAAEMSELKRTITTVEASVLDYKTKLESSLREMATEQADHEGTRAARSKLLIDVQECRSKLQAVQNEHVQTQQQLAASSSELSQLKPHAAMLRSSVEKTKDDLNSCKAELSMSIKHGSKLEESLAALQSEHTMLLSKLATMTKRAERRPDTLAQRGDVGRRETARIEWSEAYPVQHGDAYAGTKPNSTRPGTRRHSHRTGRAPHPRRSRCPCTASNDAPRCICGDWRAWRGVRRAWQLMALHNPARRIAYE